jgi:hypothetical protein
LNILFLPSISPFISSRQPVDIAERLLRQPQRQQPKPFNKRGDRNSNIAAAFFKCFAPIELKLVAANDFVGEGKFVKEYARRMRRREEEEGGGICVRGGGGFQ